MSERRKGPPRYYRRHPVAERFWAKVEKTDTCWLWRGAHIPNGYGSMWIFRPDGRYTQCGVHRISYELNVGPIPEGMEIDHRCRVRDCVNPDHLRLATRKQQNENRGRPRGISGVLGVTWDKHKKRWRASVKHHGKVYYGGSFASLDDAEKAVIALRNELYTHNDADREAG